MKAINKKDLAKLKKKKATIIVDIREENQFEDFNIGGINIPSHQITSRLNELENNENIIVVCESGTIGSIMARVIETRLPNKNVYYLEEGIY